MVQCTLTSTLAESDCTPFTISTAEITYGNDTNGIDETFMFVFQRPALLATACCCTVFPRRRGCARTTTNAPGSADPSTENVLPTVAPLLGDAINGAFTLLGAGACADASATFTS